MSHITPDSQPSTAPSHHQIGRRGEAVFALAFRSGGFDTVMQLGVIHALMVSERRAPDAVAGVSAGALNAAALAEIIQEASPEKQVGRFREFLNAYRDAPREFKRAFLPDTYEVDAKAPLKLIKLPIHCEGERSERTRAVESKTGLIRLFNSILALRLPVSILTRLLHLSLEFTEAGALPQETWTELLKKKRKRFTAALRIWGLTFFYLPHISPVSWQVFRAFLLPSKKVKRKDPGRSAGEIISGTARIIRRVTFASQYLAGYWVSLFVWLLIPILAPFYATYLYANATYFKHVRKKASKHLSVGQRILVQLLARFDLDREIADAYPLKQLLIRLFDRGYYGLPRRDEIVERALDNEENPAPREGNAQKTLGMYAIGSARCPGIHVAPVVTNLADGQAMVPPPDTSVVDALLAATAMVPFFKPVQVDGVKCIDAVNVSNEPTPALIDYLRDKVHDSSAVYIYPVAAFPTSASALSNGVTPYTGLVDILQRVQELSRFQQANLSRKLTKLYTRLLPPDRAWHQVGDKAFLSTHLFPIEADTPLRVNERLAAAETEVEKEQIVFETIAAGCRATLEVVIQPQMKNARGAAGTTISCREAMARLHPAPKPLPGSLCDGGPGLAEVCSACSLKLAGSSGESRPKRQSLRILAEGREWPEWPHQNAVPIPSLPYVEPMKKVEDKACNDPSPWVSLLFSGGVFRGVFQVGVLNALVQAKVTPRLFAGSSVGSIMAAMAARLFSEHADERPARMVELAATFLALDRLILTDRFADFVRRFTIRAASTDLSFHDMDVLFRRYDSCQPGRFSRNSRRVIAGLERLLYVSPFELMDLVKAVRLQQTSEAYKLVRRYLQELLERYDTGLEILGAEPLEMLIAEHVLKSGTRNELNEYYDHPRRAPFDLFQCGDLPKYLLATATNLTTGTLEIIGEGALTSDRASREACRAMLLDSLLASSAFPGVFRPRRSSEVFPQDQRNHQYIDGGFMDNLPLDAVVGFLDTAAKEGKTVRRPQNGEAPHLLLTASLEPELSTLDDRQVQEICSSWPLLLQRTRQLSYNRKVDKFAMAQREFRAIYKQFKRVRTGGWQPLDIEVVSVKPRWLCHTFGFHPMLGFRRWKQAASIAHGCASTLAELHKINPDYQKAWGISLQFDPATIASTADLMPKADEERLSKGLCWFRVGAVCPFSRQGLDMLAQKKPKQQTRKGLQRIYELCGHPETHTKQ